MCSCTVLFFKRKTAYEMRISDWSSDVCSSDLWMILALSWNILSWYSGYFSFGHGAFFGIGMYTSAGLAANLNWRSEEHTSELQSLMRISYAVFCLNKKKQ